MVQLGTADKRGRQMRGEGGTTDSRRGMQPRCAAEVCGRGVRPRSAAAVFGLGVRPQCAAWLCGRGVRP